MKVNSIEQNLPFLPREGGGGAECDDEYRDNIKAQEDEGDPEDHRSRDSLIHEGIMPNCKILFVEGIDYTCELERERKTRVLAAR